MTIRKPSGFEVLANALATGDCSRAVESQEASGQRQLVAAEQLPTDGLDATKCAECGITIKGPTAGDPMFTDVEFPDGITKRATEHPVWSELVRGDDVIATMFYKAAFYDRRAFISWKL